MWYFILVFFFDDFNGEKFRLGVQLWYFFVGVVGFVLGGVVGLLGFDKGGCFVGCVVDGEFVGFVVGEGKMCELLSCFVEVELFWNGRGNIGEFRKVVLRFEMVGDQFD